jgi:hypothetical protein
MNFHAYSTLMGDCDYDGWKERWWMHEMNHKCFILSIEYQMQNLISLDE